MSVDVTFVGQWYPPEPTDVPESIVLALQDQGLQMAVLTGVPNYPTGRVSPGYRPSRPAREVRRGIPVHRAPLYPSHDASAVRRFLNYGSWALSAAWFGRRLLGRADVALVYSSPATAALPAMVAKTLRGTPYVLLVQDVWPDSIFASGFLTGRLGRVVKSLVAGFVNRAYAGAAEIVVISPGMVELLAERGVAREKLSVVHNWLPETPTADSAPADVSLRDLLGITSTERVVLYAGNHGRAQALHVAVDAFLDGRTDSAHLVLLGDGVEKPALQQRASGHPRIHFLDPVDRTTATALATDADVNLVSLGNDPLFAVTMPSKFQSSLAVGKPVLVVGEGDVVATVQRHAAGYTAAPGDVESLVRAVMALNATDFGELAATGERSAHAYSSEMAREIGAPKLAETLRRAARTHPRRRRPAQPHDIEGGAQ